MGDPSGIGPAITASAIEKLKGFAGFTVIGDKWVFEKATKLQGLKAASCQFIDLHNVSHKDFKFGKVKAEYGRASIEYVDQALELIKNKQIDCLVTCPVSKEAVSLARYNNFSGHTEYLASRTNTGYFAMMLLNKKLRFSLATRHIALKEVSSRLSSSEIYKTALLTYRSLKRLFFIKKPRIAVCGVNPHASDNGLLGKEENEIIKPAVARLKRIIKDIDGPLSADTAVLRAAQGKYDCVIAMYHDQALIPLKLSGASFGVNLTLGLGFVRTSPLHGTAFDIAGKPDLADAGSLIEAIKVGVLCSLNQKKG